MINDEDLSPGMKQYKDLKNKYTDCILFFRLGDFYEMFFEDAILASKLLGITLTAKNCGKGQKAPMCGVPYHAYESYVAKLIASGHKVGICEQLEEPNSKRIVERDVVRIITPGTVVDESMLDESLNTYIMCIYKNKDTIYYAYTDISTGEFYVGESGKEKCLNYINDQIMRVQPSEIICNEEMLEFSDDLQSLKSKSGLKLNQYYEWAFNISTCEKEILKAYNLKSTKGYDFSTSGRIIVCGALLQYIGETQKRELKHLDMPRFLHDDQFMYLDTNTRRNLEIEQTMRDGNKVGSLLWVLDKTETGGGARKLRHFINQPLQDINEINKRLSCVKTLKDNILLRTSLNAEFKNVRDIERHVGKLGYGTIAPKDCLAILETLKCSPNIKELLLNSNSDELIKLGENIKNFDDLSQEIFTTIDKNAPSTMKDGGYIKEGRDAELDRLRGIYNNSTSYIISMEARERESTGIKSLKIGYNKVFGYYIEVSKQYAGLVPFSYIRKQTLTTGERYITEELKNFETEVLSSHDSALKIEERIYREFKEKIMTYCQELKNLADILSTVDAYLSLAIVADENNYVMPKMINGDKINIVGGRHPVIEKIQRGNNFIPNDCLLDCEENNTMILTGPNMAGKSTYMRQVALITLMAHIGSFVPADSAEICIVDRIFTRIGASDDLAVGQSTFMVEMVEVSNILRFATNKSLVILDEVGRGTSTHDGLSIAWAVVDYISKNLACKTLFATHYHELMQLESKLKGVKNYCISIKEIAGELVFLRKIMRGSATRSYGIEVASLAGLPKGVIDSAKSLLKDLEDGKIDGCAPKPNKQSPKHSSEIVDILKSIDVNTISPMVAFDTLIRLVELSKEN